MHVYLFTYIFFTYLFLHIYTRIYVYVSIFLLFFFFIPHFLSCSQATCSPARSLFSTPILLLSTSHFPSLSHSKFPTHLQYSAFTRPSPLLLHFPRPPGSAPVEVIEAPPLGISFIQFLGEIKHFYTVHNGLYGPNTGFDYDLLLFILVHETY